MAVPREADTKPVATTVEDIRKDLSPARVPTKAGEPNLVDPAETLAQQFAALHAEIASLKARVTVLGG